MDKMEEDEWVKGDNDDGDYDDAWDPSETDENVELSGGRLRIAGNTQGGG